MTSLAVYFHIPFCTVKCGYCDFNAYAGMDRLKAGYTRALLLEIEGWREAMAGHDVTSIAFGGGTPGEMPAGDLAAIIGALRSAGTIARDAEIGLEANPGSIGPDHLCQLAAAGVNRISFGAQSFDAGELRFLDRIHSPEAIAATVANARRAGIASVNLDLIYGLPGQSPARWRWTMDQALALQPDHLSLYALTVEDGTILARRVQDGSVILPGPDEVADLYELASARLDEAGFHQYELSNWARPGHESRHNLTYWSDGDYLGLGAGAHGYISGERYENVAHPREYIRLLSAQPHSHRAAVAHAYRPPVATAMADWLSLGLRRTAGVDPGAFLARFGSGLYGIFGSVLGECAEAGLVEMSGERTRLTRAGRLLHGEVSVRILLAVEESGGACPGSLSAILGPQG